MQELFNQLKANVSEDMVIMGGIIIVAVLLLTIAIRIVRNKQIKKQLEQMELKYSEFKSISLSFKLNKANALAKVNKSIVEAVGTLQIEFDEAQELLKEFRVSLAEIDDFVYSKKQKKAVAALEKLLPFTKECEVLLFTLNEKLDEVLEEENTQRNNINELKKSFRTIKKEYIEHRSEYRQSCDYIDTLIVQTENMFTIFEEWMFASEFNKASQKYGEIKGILERIQIILIQVPPYYEKISVVLPMLLEEVKLSAQSAQQRGVFLEHLDLERNFETVQTSMTEGLIKLQDCNLETIPTLIKDTEVRIEALHTNIKLEEDSFDHVLGKAAVLFNVIKQLNVDAQGIKDTFERVYERFGFDYFKGDIASLNEDLDKLNAQRIKMEQTLNEKQVPYATMVATIDDIENKSYAIEEVIKLIQVRLETATSDEERAKKQLIKLQLVVNEMRINIVKHKLPSVDEKFEEDVRNANIYIIDIKEILNATPLDVDRLNSKLKEAIDYIYTLYNSVNNLVSMASMVEHAILFGNKYRSSHMEMDSELTRAELCFSNGQYTRALKIAISAIEKLHPGVYEKIIQDKHEGETIHV